MGFNLFEINKFFNRMPQMTTLEKYRFVTEVTFKKGKNMLTDG